MLIELDVRCGLGEDAPLRIVPRLFGHCQAGDSRIGISFRALRQCERVLRERDRCGYALSGDVTREELLPVARSDYEELNAPAAKGG